MYQFRSCSVISLYFLYLLLILHFIDGLNGQPDTSKMFNIAGVFPTSSSAPAIAAKMAVEDINAFASRTGANTHNKVTLMFSESGCNPKTTAAEMYKIMSTGQPKPIILAGCPQDCEMISKASPIWNAITICYGMSQIPQYGLGYPLSSTLLPQPSLFLSQPHLFSLNAALVKFVRHFGWKRVAVLNQDTENYFVMAHELRLAFQHHETEVVGLEVFSFDELSEALDQIKRENVRVIFTLANEPFSREILCQSYRRGLVGPEKYVWFFLGPRRTEWFVLGNSGPGNDEEETEGLLDEIEGPIRQANCSPEELSSAADGHFTAKALLWNPNEEMKTVSGMNVREFRARMLSQLREAGEHLNTDFDEAPLAYDSVWAAYLALNQTTSIQCSDGRFPCEFAYDNYGFDTNGAMVHGLKFQGVSGEVSFTDGGKRSIGNAAIKIARFKNNRQTQVAMHFNSNNTFSWFDDHPFGTNIPEDGYDFDSRDPDLELEPTESPISKCNSASTSSFVINIYNLIYVLPIYYIMIVDPHVRSKLDY